MSSLPDHLAPSQARTVALARVFLGDQGGGHLDTSRRCLVDYSWAAEDVEAAVADPDPWRWLMRLVDVEQRGLARWVAQGVTRE